MPDNPDGRPVAADQQYRVGYSRARYALGFVLVAVTQETTVIDNDMRRFYEQGRERERLTRGTGGLELARTQELLARFLPPPPADVLDVGGGPGVYAAWLARGGYRVSLFDPIPLHIEQATAVAAAQPDHPFAATLGDGRNLAAPDASFDAVLLFGPLYHLTQRDERLAALAEGRRVLRPGGIALVAAISRFGTLLDGVRQGYFADSEAAIVIEETVRTGQNRNPGLAHFPGWFTTAFFHRPDELAAEVRESGLSLEAILGVEGPGGFVGSGWDDLQQRPHILRAARLVEQEASVLGLSPHLLAVARKSS